MIKENLGQTTPVAGGFRVAGRWSCASGCHYLDLASGPERMLTGGHRPCTLDCLAVHGRGIVHNRSSAARRPRLHRSMKAVVEVSCLIKPVRRGWLVRSKEPKCRMTP